MAEFDIIDIKRNERGAFNVEIELLDRQRRHFGYPMGEGWEADIDGIPKFVRDISSKLDNEALTVKTMDATVKAMTTDLKLKRFRIDAEKPKTKKANGKEASMK